MHRPDGNDQVVELLRTHVPELAARTVTIKAIAREAGKQTILVVHTQEPAIDPVGCCVGVRGERIKSIVRALNGEKIDVIPWTNSTEQLIANLLCPSVTRRIEVQHDAKRATAFIDAKRSLNPAEDEIRLRLVSEISGFKIKLIAG